MIADAHQVEQQLRGVYSSRQAGSATRENTDAVIADLKRQAVCDGDQLLAKHLWCLQRINVIQSNYVDAFAAIQEQRYYDAWCLFERVEIDLESVIRHHSSDLSDAYGLTFIEKHISQFQSLYPYKLFMSPAFLHLEKICSICRAPISIRHPCDHKKGEIYDGEMCVHEVTKVELLEMSLVPCPVQKYSVPFISKPGGEGIHDHYNYSAVAYVGRGLRSPWDAWEMHKTTALHPHAHFQHVGTGDPCPCESGKTYGKCCLRRPGVVRPHIQISFSVKPPEELDPLLFI